MSQILASASSSSSFSLLTQLNTLVKKTQGQASTDVSDRDKLIDKVHEVVNVVEGGGLQGLVSRYLDDLKRTAESPIHLLYHLRLVNDLISKQAMVEKEEVVDRLGQESLKRKHIEQGGSNKKFKTVCFSDVLLNQIGLELKSQTYPLSRGPSFPLSRQDYCEAVPPDVTFVFSDKKEIKAHRSILCYHDYWRKLFALGTVEGQSGQINIEKDKFEDWNLLLDFIYTENLPIQSALASLEGFQNAVDYASFTIEQYRYACVLNLASKYGVKSLERLCLVQIEHITAQMKQVWEQLNHQPIKVLVPVPESPRWASFQLDRSNTSFCDCTLRFGSGVIYANKAVLGTRSVFFRLLFAKYDQSKTQFDLSSSQLSLEFLHAWISYLHQGHDSYFDGNKELEKQVTTNPNLLFLILKIAHLDCWGKLHTFCGGIVNRIKLSSLSSYFKGLIETLSITKDRIEQRDFIDDLSSYPLLRRLFLLPSAFDHIEPQAILTLLLGKIGRQLRYLNCSGNTWLNSSTVHLITTYCPHLQEIDLTNCPKVDDKVVEAISSKCPHLRKMDLKGCTAISKDTNKFEKNAKVRG